MRPMLVVGAGPAGVSAACSLSAAGVKVVLVDRHAGAGGAVWHYGGHTASFGGLNLGGAEIRAFLHQRILEAKRDYGLEVIFESKVQGLHEDEFSIVWDERVFSGAILTVGARPNSMDLHRPESGIFVGPGKILESQVVAKKSVAVLGGGDNAMENAWRMQREGARVVVFSRRLPRGFDGSGASGGLYLGALQAGVEVVIDPDYRQMGRSVLSFGREYEFDLMSVLYGFVSRSDLWWDCPLRWRQGDGVMQVSSRIVLAGDVCRHGGDRSLDSAWEDGVACAKWTRSHLLGVD